MKMKNRKGSTLILTLLVFVVLTIFGTFILSFMSSENKMSLKHQYKTQAYYIARSGAVAVEAAIMEMNEGEKNKLISMDDNTTKDITVTYDTNKNIPVKISKNEDNLEIISTATVNKMTETVTKTLNIKVGESVAINNNFVVLSNEGSDKNNIPDYLIDENYVITNASKDIYKPYDFGEIEVNLDSPIKEIPINNILGEENSITDYVVDNLNINGEITIRGKVNIYVKKIVTIDSNHKSPVWSTNKNKEDLNIYILSDEKDETKRLIYNDDDSKLTDKSFKSNIYIGSGKVDISLNKSYFNSNIISNGTGVYVHTQTGNVDHQSINGNIYAPNATVQMDLNALSLNGFVVGEYLKLHHQNGKDYPKKGKLTLKDGSNQELDKDGKPEINYGHFK